MARVIFRLAMRLYPRDHQTTFGAEMLDVFEQASADAWRKGVAAGLAFSVREPAGLVLEAIRIRLQTPPTAHESWWWSLEAPALAVLLYSLAVTVSQDLGVFGFFFPATYLVAAVLAAVSAWVVGRTCTLLRRPRRYGVTVVAALIAVLLVPAAIRMTEDAQARALTRDADFTVPGIQVSGTATTAPSRVPGLLFTRVVTDPNGAAMTLVHLRSHSAPPYLAIGGILTGLIALISRRRVSA